jgi:hypothetical protein
MKLTTHLQIVLIYINIYVKTDELEKIWKEAVVGKTKTTGFGVPSLIPYARPGQLSLCQLPVLRDIDNATFSLLDILVHSACCALKQVKKKTLNLIRR